MAIQKLEITGFRSLKHVTWRPGPLNLLVGPNGGGKSNVLRCLELISTVAGGGLQDSIEQSGGVVPILWDRKARSIGWRLHFDLAKEGWTKIEDRMVYEFELAQLRPQSSAYEIKKDTLGNWCKFDAKEAASPYWIFNRDTKEAYFYDQQAGNLVPLEEENSDNPDGYDANESLLAQIGDIRNRIPALTRRVIEDWNIHHDVHAQRGSAMRSPATTQYSKRLAPDGRNLATVLHTLYTDDREFRSQINNGMKAGFGSEFERIEIQPVSAGQVQLAVQWNSSSSLHAGSDLSDGTLRFLFLLTVLCNPEPGAVIAVDEPEIGLNPSMLPIIAEYAAAAAERTQVILTSHSPEFLDAFSEMSPHVTLCHWEEGQTHLYPLEPDALAEWLERYRLGQLFTQGELETLAQSPVDKLDDFEARFKDLPSEDDALSQLPDHPGESVDG